MLLSAFRVTPDISRIFRNYESSQLDDQFFPFFFFIEVAISCFRLHELLLSNTLHM